MKTAQQRPILLVGSIPLDSAEAVFKLAGEVLGERLAYMPDGETGDRKNWINWQRKVLAQTPFLEERAAAASYGAAGPTRFGVRGELPEGAAFGALGYAEAAANSYEIFRRLRHQGSIPRETRFQVSLPTPLAPLIQSLVPDDIPAVEPIYSRAMEREVGAICEAIPPEDLALQWDVAIEIALLEGVAPIPAPPMKLIVQQLAKLASWAPPKAKLGFHFCYGDAGHKHFKEPVDMGLMVSLASDLLAITPRQIDWFHMPVPRTRTDNSYFAPLADLKLVDGTRLFLGLIHRTDGLPGAMQRIATAERFVTDFGVATECGWGRRPRETIQEVMHLNAEVSRA